MKAQLGATFATLAPTANVTYVVSDDWRITETNEAWHTFARDNGCDRLHVGASLLDVIPPALLPFYQSGFARAAASGQRWEHDYECSSPQLFRRFRMLAYPFDDSFVVTHALLIETPHPWQMFQPGGTYECNGCIVMCAHCRRVRATSERERWDWVPDYLRVDQSRTTHGLCPGCYSYYYELS